MQEALEPLSEVVRAALAQPRKDRPDDVVIEFGAPVGGGRSRDRERAGCHLSVTV
ncbi:hypothetical protein [Streptomyces sp. NPDC058457]|uniref:hypothetical protein n=1 Tax=Streptomyces sp. NPDC058457 TaxID=3346507 RepID=UPI00366642B1